jgi:peptidoglycan/LPS O-acetylase OafA/YrhL
LDQRPKQHLRYIECLRGYAVLLVILCHSAYLFPGLPYPVHRVAVLGWHGVQLFFLASAVTLMMSWHDEKSRRGEVAVGAFFVRRFFRIAPAYYLAAILYFLIEPPADGFDAMQAASTLVFLNSWFPTLMGGVTTNSWSVVPGGWSIGVEFTFYAVFPVLAWYIVSLPRAARLALGALVVGAALNSQLAPSMEAKFGQIPADNFLYFWFPNQMSVFALGICLYFLLERDRGRRSVFSMYPNFIAALTIVLIGATAFIPLPQRLDLLTPLPPAFLVVSLLLMVFVLALARSRSGLFINAPVALIGRVSFSAYLLYFAVLRIVSYPSILHGLFGTTGWSAIIAFPAALVCIVLIVLAASWCTYRFIETPMIDLGKKLLRQRRAALA